jgi:hypothetical protein
MFNIHNLLLHVSMAAIPSYGSDWRRTPPSASSTRSKRTGAGTGRR